VEWIAGEIGAAVATIGILADVLAALALLTHAGLANAIAPAGDLGAELRLHAA
jgi:hypothetical protein